MTDDALERRLSAIVSADVVGYGRLMAADEAETVRTLGRYRDEVGLLARHHRGRVVDFTGDNFLAEFPTATAAVDCALEIHRVVAARNEALPEPRRMRFRIGIHLGEVAVEGGRLYGDGVNIAARLETLAPPGGTCVSGAVRDQVKRHRAAAFEDLGSRELKNVPDPVRVFRLRSEAGVPVPSPGTASRGGTRIAALALAGLALVALGFLLATWRGDPPAASVAASRFRIPIPDGGSLASGSFPPVAISPDGRSVAYAARVGGTSRLFLRFLDRFESVPIAKTEGAVSPFFSPDGSWVGYFATGALFKVRVSGGDPVQIVETSNFSFPSAHWGGDGTIRDTRGINVSGGLRQVPAGGGEARALTRPDFESGERWHGLAQLLPGGDLLFTIATAEGYRAALLPAGASEWSVLEELGPAVAARYLPGGHLVFGQSGRLMAAPWEPGRASPGRTSLVVDRVHTSRLGLPFFAVSADGTLVYAQGGLVATRPVLLDPQGNATTVATDPGAFQHPRLSPDGGSLAVDITWRGRTDVYVYDLARGVRRRLTHTGFNIDPLWTLDGSALLFRSTRRDAGGQNIFRVPADGSGRPELLLESEKDKIPGSWGRNGALLAYTDISERRTMAIGVLDLAAGTTAPLLASPYNVGWPVFSPDGRWLAFTSTESGRTDVWVRRFPETGPALQVSVGGGSEPLWARDGSRLYFRRGDRFLAVDADPTQGVRPETVRELFRGRFDLSPTGHQHYDVDADGRFAAIALENATDPEALHVVTGWGGEIERRVGRGR